MSNSNLLEQFDRVPANEWYESVQLSNTWKKSHMYREITSIDANALTTLIQAVSYGLIRFVESDKIEQQIHRGIDAILLCIDTIINIEISLLETTSGSVELEGLDSNIDKWLDGKTTLSILPGNRLAILENTLPGLLSAALRYDEGDGETDIDGVSFALGVVAE